jgi:hypothetical protein
MVLVALGAGRAAGVAAAWAVYVVGGAIIDAATRGQRAR